MSLGEPQGGDGMDATEIEPLLRASEASRRIGDAESGRTQADRALALALERSDLRAAAQALMLKGVHEFRLGDNEGALAALDHAAGLFQELGDDAGRALAQARMVLAYHNLGLSQRALEVSEQAVESAKRSGDAAVLSTAYASAGTANDAVGFHEAALSATNLAFELATESGDEMAMFSALNNRVDDLLALAHNRLKVSPQEFESNVEQAISAGEEALRLAEELSVYQRAMALVNLGEALRIAGRASEAQELLAEAQELAADGGFRSLALSARETTARLMRDAGDLDTAAELFQELLADAVESDEGRFELDALRALSEVHRDRGAYRVALQYLERFVELDAQLRTEVAETRARLLADQVELDRMSRSVELAARDAEAERARAIELEEQKQALQHRTEELLRRADEDGLTGLWNRRYVERVLPQLLRAAREHAAPVSALMVDADHFKTVNDNFGHRAGDEVLRRLATLLRSHVRPIDAVARIGGEEFIIVLPGAAAEDAHDLAERLCARVRGTDWSDIVPGQTPTISIGVATIAAEAPRWMDTERAVEDLISRADTALYAAKRAGRDCVAVADS